MHMKLCFDVGNSRVVGHVEGADVGRWGCSTSRGALGLLSPWLDRSTSVYYPVLVLLLS